MLNVVTKPLAEGGGVDFFALNVQKLAKSQKFLLWMRPQRLLALWPFLLRGPFWDLVYT